MAKVVFIEINIYLPYGWHYSWCRFCDIFMGLFIFVQVGNVIGCLVLILKFYFSHFCIELVVTDMNIASHMVYTFTVVC